jgi:hypothetical protein
MKSVNGEECHNGFKLILRVDCQFKVEANKRLGTSVLLNFNPVGHLTCEICEGTMG